MNLTIDIGNTFTKLAIFDNNQIVYSNWEIKNLDLELVAVREKYPLIEKSIILSVKTVKLHILDIVYKHYPKTQILSHKSSLDFKIGYKTPETLGTDRIAAVAGAKACFPNKTVLIIDIGTAITYDIVVEGENYLGGNISPGIDLRFKALHNFTSKLPLVNKEHTSENLMIGLDTKSAIYNGVIFGMKSEIDEYINQAKKHYKNLEVIITGGDSIFFQKLLKNNCFTNKNLIFVGLNYILQL